MNGVHFFSSKKEFAHLLSRKERIILVRAFAYLAHLDNKLHQNEISSISTFAHNLGLDPQIIIEDGGTLDLENIFKPVENGQSKRIIIQELIHLAYTDGDYSQEERAGIKHIAEILGLDTTLLVKIEEWVEKGREWAKEGTQLILEGQ